MGTLGRFVYLAALTLGLCLFEGAPEEAQAATVPPVCWTATAPPTPPALAYSPTTLAFSNVSTGKSQNLTITISNSGQTAATGVTQGGLTPPFTLLSTTCSGTLAAGGSCTSTVAFAPTVPGTTGEILTASASGIASVSAAVSGTGALRDWTTKPPFGTALRTDGDWSVAGLFGCWLLNEGTGAIAHSLVPNGDLQFLDAGSTAPVWVPAGMAFSHGVSGTVYGHLSSPAGFFPNNSAFTVVQNVTVQPLAPYEDMEFWSVYGSGLPAIGLGVSGDGGGNYYRMRWGWNGTETNSAAYRLPPGNYTLATVVSGTSVSIYRNGALFYASTLGAPPPYKGTFSIGSYHRDSSNTTYYGLNGSVGFTLLYNRALSPAEVAAISANPWKVAQPY
ncbi:choice-of-anchor D domain-containing protein [Geomesophilobacter sediminis]|uniref:Choice-of-anchor D domain-containing protein n=1 Tax=Geomesophilobacter sediminis TaxID=2798584 RepID=A0A8J7LTQ4_9BACT|nr:choice-of-anchor D domain-containing protein [Geomesophilobacter sediminis]MBJ6723689.1 choice-of-anchor D domain-containing protein [Geomesophilobacter sediminis]